jgi:hypothetical protein
MYTFFFHGAKASSGPRPHHYRGFTIILRHTTLGRTPLDEWSAQYRNLYLTTPNTHKRQESMSPAWSEPTIPASERLRTDVLDRAAIGISFCVCVCVCVRACVRACVCVSGCCRMMSCWSVTDIQIGVIMTRCRLVDFDGQCTETTLQTRSELKIPNLYSSSNRVCSECQRHRIVEEINVLDLHLSGAFIVKHLTWLIEISKILFSSPYSCAV